MQRYFLPANNLYGNEPVEICFPDDWSVRTCSYFGADLPRLDSSGIKARLDRELSGRKISELANGRKSAAIVFDDITRPTPIKEIAEIVLDELLKAGIQKENIVFVAAVGCHRAMSREDNVRKLGENIVQNYAVFSHNPFAGNVSVGTTSYGVNIHLNSCVASADFIIGIGSVFPHGAIGIGGGSKLICPGIAGFDSIKAQHSMSRGRWDIGLDSRKNAQQAANLLGVDLIIDALLNGKGEPADIIAGRPDEVIDGHVQDIINFFECGRYEKADLVIANNYFKPTEVSVAVNGTGVMDAVKDGGDIIVSAHTPQGTANHYLFGAWNEDVRNGGKRAGVRIPPHVNRYIAFSKYLDLGTGQGWHPVDDKRFMWASDWTRVLDVLGSRPRSVLIFDYATAGFYGPSGNG